MESFLATRPPANKAELRSLNGMATYYSERLPDLANIRGPLQHLMKKNAVFKWTDKETTAFNNLKASMIKGALGHYKIEHKTILYVDAGPYGVSAILTQEDPVTNQITLISCAAHSFTKTEQNYSQNDKESFAVTWGVLKYEHYLRACPLFKIYTDNRAVSIIFDKETPSKPKTPQRLVSWRSKITQFNYEIKHISGT